MCRTAAAGVAVALACGMWPGAALAQQTPSGCYDVFPGPWAEVPRGGTISGPRGWLPEEGYGDSYFSVPSRLEFTREGHPLEGSPWLRLSVPDHVLPSPHANLFWRIDGSAVALSFGHWFAGTRGSLTRDGDEWHGHVTTYSDMLDRPNYRRPLRLVPVDCASPAIEPAHLETPLPRVVELASGHRLVLGERLPDGVTWRRRGGGGAGLTISVPTAGLFAGADSVVFLRATESTRMAVMPLHLRADWDALYQRLDAAVGPPETLTPAGPATQGSASWRGRRTSIRARQLDEHVIELVIRDPRIMFAVVGDSIPNR